jgi:hypothetical protein
MLHACLYTICFVVCYTLWHFYAFIGTNLLTRRHSASSLFSAIFVFQKSYTWNILGIGRNKSRTSYFSRTQVEVQSRDGGGPGPGHTLGRHSPSAYIFSFIGKTKRLDQFSMKPTASRRHRRREIGRVQKLFPAPCRRPSSSPWSPPEWCVSSLPWTTGP